MSCYSLNTIVTSHLSYAFSYSPLYAVVIIVSVSVVIAVVLLGSGGGTAVIVVIIKWRNKKKKVVRRRQWAKPCLAVHTHTHKAHKAPLRDICDRICEKGPLRGNVNILVRDKTRAKPPIPAIADYCIIGRYFVFPIFRPSLKPVRLSCVSNEDRIYSFTAWVALAVYGVDRKW